MAFLLMLGCPAFALRAHEEPPPPDGVSAWPPIERALIEVAHNHDKSAQPETDLKRILADLESEFDSKADLIEQLILWPRSAEVAIAVFAHVEKTQGNGRENVNYSWLVLAGSLDYSLQEAMEGVLPLLDEGWRRRFPVGRRKSLGMLEGSRELRALIEEMWESDPSDTSAEPEWDTMIPAFRPVLEADACGDCEGLIDYMLSRDPKATLEILADLSLDEPARSDLLTTAAVAMAPGTESKRDALEALIDRGEWWIRLFAFEVLAYHSREEDLFQGLVTDPHPRVRNAAQELERLRHAEKPRITRGPIDTTVEVGATVTFSCEASGRPTLGVGWRKRDLREGGDGHSNEKRDLYVDERIEGAHTGALTIHDVRAEDAGLYDCWVRTDVGFVSSNQATLEVLVPPEPGSTR